jgi:MFS family permease
MTIRTSTKPEPATRTYPSTIQWFVTGYAIAFPGLLILGGRAADLFGRRRMFMGACCCSPRRRSPVAWPVTR